MGGDGHHGNVVAMAVKRPLIRWRLPGPHEPAQTASSPVNCASAPAAKAATSSCRVGIQAMVPIRFRLSLSPLRESPVTPICVLRRPVQVFCYVCRHSLLHGSPSPFVITLTSLDETDRFARRSPHFPLVLLFANPAYCVDTPDGKQESFQMVKSLLNAVNKMFSHDDVGKLLLRLAVGGLMLFHGLHKLVAGVDGISGMLVAKGLPGFIAYGVLVGRWLRLVC